MLGHQIISYSSFNSFFQSKEGASHSGFPDPSVLLSPRVPSDHESEGNIPIHISSISDQGDKSAGLTPESSDLGPGVSLSSLEMPGFSSWGIYSGLQMRDLARMRTKYTIPNSSSFVVPSNYF